MKKCFIMLFALLTVATAYPQLPGGKPSADDIAAVTKLENAAVKADLAGDAEFYKKILADDWTGGTSRGTWETKRSVLADMKDTKNNKTNSETIADLKVRVNGDVAVATYKSTYDSLIHGKHFARTIITTDVYTRSGDSWKQIASHSSVAAGK